jgi:hypothetical protein
MHRRCVGKTDNNPLHLLLAKGRPDQMTGLNDGFQLHWYMIVKGRKMGRSGLFTCVIGKGIIIESIKGRGRFRLSKGAANWAIDDQFNINHGVKMENMLYRSVP